MNTKVITSPSWSTASFGDSAQTSPVELSALGEHLDSCRGAHGRWFALQCAAQTMHGFVAARLVTTLLLLALLIGLVSMVW